jgi:formate dehydrogenase maturation protein FdhE
MRMEIFRRTKIIDKKEYIEGNGKVCPICGSKNISSGGPQIDKDKITVGTMCYDCESTWDMIYALNGFGVDYVGPSFDNEQNLNI